jgi:hypothetical protein
MGLLGWGARPLRAPPRSRAIDATRGRRAARPGAGTKPSVDLVGVFTLHGVKRKVVIPVEIESHGPILRLTGSFRIKQTDFGIKPYKKLGGVVGVADELSIPIRSHDDLATHSYCPL